MRKILLTTAAVVGAAFGLAGVANAQTATFPPPPAGEPGPSFGTVGTTPKGAYALPAPGVLAPGSFVVHLNGRINWYAGAEGSSADNVGGYKLDPQSFVGYLRLYLGFDAEAANGLKYGVVTETRMPGSNYRGPGATPASTSNTTTLYWHTAYGYVGSDTVGTLQFGEGPGITANWQGVGTFEGFNDGGWNGDMPALVPGVTAPVFPFADDDQMWTGDKIVYFSPSFGGFQFGASYQPNTSNLWDNNCAEAGPSCNALSSSPVDGASNQQRNTIEVGGTYAGTFNGMGLAATAAYVGSSKVSAPGLFGTAVIPQAEGQFNGLSVGVLSATVSFAGFTVGGNVNYGNMNEDWGQQPRGGVNELAWIAGAQYTAGPMVVGASYFKTTMAGNWSVGTGVGRTETDNGIAVGGTYNMAPGLAFYVSYLYGTRHQAGWNFNADSPSADVLGGGGNNTHVSMIGVGSVLSW